MKPLLLITLSFSVSCT